MAQRIHRPAPGVTPAARPGFSVKVRAGQPGLSLALGGVISCPTVNGGAPPIEATATAPQRTNPGITAGVIRFPGPFRPTSNLPPRPLNALHRPPNPPLEMGMGRRYDWGMNAPQHDADAIKAYWDNAAKPAPQERHEYAEPEPVPVARRPVGRTFVRAVGTLVLFGGIIAAFGPFEYRPPFEGKFADGYAANRADELVYLARVAITIAIGFGLLIIANMPQNPE